tara:strand:- start:22233 stop:22919 length:687 start_codon:yes stop_codon:yes gene_type:complete
MKLLILSLFIALPVGAHEKCTVIHLKEAMNLNRERRELYRVDGNRDAANVMNKLILLEKVMLPFTYSLDRSVRQLQATGMGMWCDDLVSMQTVPAYQASAEAPAHEYRAPNAKTLKSLKRKMKKFEINQSEELYLQISQLISIDLADHHYNCLTRHFLESAAKSLAATRERLDIVPGELKSDLERATKKLIKQLAMSLRFAQSIDQSAAPIQARGVPVLCQEMPPIDW